MVPEGYVARIEEFLSRRLLLRTSFQLEEVWWPVVPLEAWNGVHTDSLVHPTVGPPKWVALHFPNVYSFPSTSESPEGPIQI